MNQLDGNLLIFTDVAQLYSERVVSRYCTLDVVKSGGL